MLTYMRTFKFVPIHLMPCYLALGSLSDGLQMLVRPLVVGFITFTLLTLNLNVSILNMVLILGFTSLKIFSHLVLIS